MKYVESEFARNMNIKSNWVNLIPFKIHPYELYLFETNVKSHLTKSYKCLKWNQKTCICPIMPVKR